MVRRILWHLGRHPIGRFPVGRSGAIAGRVTRADPLRGPLTGEPCAAYQLLVWAVADAETSSWGVVASHCAEFTVEDATGRARVEPGAEELALSCRRIAAGRPGVDLPPALEPLLARRGLPSPWGLFVCEERSLRVGDWVVVCGAGDVEPDPSSGGADYRQVAPSRLVLSASPSFPLAISNDPVVREQPKRTVRLV